MITRTANVAACTPAGYEYNDRSYNELPLLENVVTGDELKLTSTGWRKRTAGEVPNGIALEPGKAGRKGLGIGIMGEMDGFAGLVPGTWLYPDAATPGDWQTATIASYVPKVFCVTTSRVRFCYMTG